MVDKETKKDFREFRKRMGFEGELEEAFQAKVVHKDDCDCSDCLEEDEEE